MEKLGKIYANLRKDWKEIKRKAIIEFIKQKGMARTKEIAEALGLSQATVSVEVNNLVFEGKLMKIERNSMVYYKVRE